MLFTRLIFTIAALLFSPFIFSQNAPIDVHRLTSEINFDGLVDEAAWNDVPLTEFKMQVPQFGQEPTERTEVRLAYVDHCSSTCKPMIFNHLPNAARGGGFLQVVTLKK
jgi:hypothetical protein